MFTPPPRARSPCAVLSHVQGELKIMEEEFAGLSVHVAPRAKGRSGAGGDGRGGGDTVAAVAAAATAEEEEA